MGNNKENSLENYSKTMERDLDEEVGQN